MSQLFEPDLAWLYIYCELAHFGDPVFPSWICGGAKKPDPDLLPGSTLELFAGSIYGSVPILCWSYLPAPTRFYFPDLPRLYAGTIYRARPGSFPGSFPGSGPLNCPKMVGLGLLNYPKTGSEPEP